MTFLKIQLL